MTSLISELLINPVLRQTRRFSRSGPRDDHIDSATSQRTADAPRESPDGGIIEIAGNGEAMAESSEANSSISGRLLVSSPPLLEEDDEYLETRPGGGRQSDTPLPLRVSSYRSEAAAGSDDVSDNPSYGVSDQLQTRLSTSSIQNGVQSTTATGPRPSSNALPEDDGMKALRRKIIAIQALDLPTEEKARQMHDLLTEGYTQSQINIHTKPLPRTYSPASLISQERPQTPASTSSFNFWPLNDSPSPPPSANSFLLSPEDLKPTYAPLPHRSTAADQSETTDDTEPEPSLGCVHYKRNVKLQCSTCNRWYTCRHCHDAAEDHLLNRKETKNMLCMLCGSAQKVAEVCADCGVRAAWYYCSVCHLWDDDTNKSIYHCNDCGICRVGRGLGKDFFHCKTCGLCMSISMEQSHKCIERSTDCDCPICGEYMFTSPQTVVFMRCGHTIHRGCYYEHMKSSYKCPICSQTVINMATQFRNLDRAIDMQPMPPQFQDTKAMILCNDCRAKSAVKYHWLGLKCAICDSYNTTQLSLLSDPDPEVAAPPAPAPIANPVIPTPAPENIGLSITGSTRPRRHSSYSQSNLAPADQRSPFSPYRLLERYGRSASPVRRAGYFATAMAAQNGNTAETDEDEDLDFWGRSSPHSPGRSMVAAEEENEEDDSDDGSDLSMDEADEDADDDGDEVDRMELFGHR